MWCNMFACTVSNVHSLNPYSSNLIKYFPPDTCILLLGILAHTWSRVGGIEGSSSGIAHTWSRVGSIEGSSSGIAHASRVGSTESSSLAISDKFNSSASRDSSKIYKLLIMKSVRFFTQKNNWIKNWKKIKLPCVIMFYFWHNLPCKLRFMASSTCNCSSNPKVCGGKHFFCLKNDTFAHCCTFERFT